MLKNMGSIRYQHLMTINVREYSLNFSKSDKISDFVYVCVWYLTSGTSELSLHGTR